MRSTEQQAADLGVEAQHVLNNPAFREALKRMQDDCIAALKTIPIRDDEGRRLWAQTWRLTDKVETTLLGILEQGKLARAKLDIDDVRNESGLRRGLRKVTGR